MGNHLVGADSKAILIFPLLLPEYKKADRCRMKNKNLVDKCLNHIDRRKSIENITGRRFGILTVVEPTGKRNNHNKMFWLCKCDCGKTKITLARSLKKGSPKSCGCLSSIGHKEGGRKGGRKSASKSKRPMGYKKKHRDGYVYMKCDCHPNAGKDGRILEHIYIMSRHLERPLKKQETIHHKNGLKDDNRVENLELWSKNHPNGQRISDMITFCYEYLKVNAAHLVKTTCK